MDKARGQTKKPAPQEDPAKVEMRIRILDP